MSDQETRLPTDDLPPIQVSAETAKALRATLRHELRTPMNHIIGYSEMLLEEAEELKWENFVPDLERIHTAGNKLLNLINDILDPAKTEINTANLAMLRHDLLNPLNLIMGYSEMLQEEANDNHQEEVLPDLQRIHTAARNLLDLIREVFTSPNLERPQLLAQPDSPFINREAALVQIVPPRALTLNGYLLVVDDNEMNRDMLSRRLERQGFRVAAAENGYHALEMVKAEKFDLILLDIMMPEIDGYQVLTNLKSDAGLRDIPVIMLSALDNIDSVVRCIEIGAEDYLPKPFDPVLLRARIGACLEKKFLRDQEVLYLQEVARITAAAAAIETENFDPETLDGVAGREDELGQLARVFQHMAREVYAREQRLKQQVEQLKIEIDQSKKAHQVAEITETDYFQQLQRKATQLRNQVKQ
jgi:DNA-binding response OmpR family regulator